MAGLIIVIGIVVDDAIVVSESIRRHSEMGKSALDAAVDGTEEVFKPVLTTILTTILAFSPMFFIDGVLGDFVFVIPLVVCMALAVSFIESIFALPSHLISGVTGNTKALTAKKSNHESHWFKTWLVKPFTKLVDLSLRSRYIVIAIFIGILFGSIYYAKNHIDFILFPTDSSEEIDVLIELPTGSSLDATVDVVKQVEEVLMSMPEGEVDSFVVRAGRVGKNVLFRNSNNAFIIVYLTSYSSRERGARLITKELKEKVEHIKNSHIAFQISAGGPPV